MMENRGPPPGPINFSFIGPYIGIPECFMHVQIYYFGCYNYFSMRPVPSNEPTKFYCHEKVKTSGGRLLDCKYKFKTRYALTYHQAMHEAPYLCTMCPKRFVRQTDLESHVTNYPVHDKKGYFSL